MNTHKEVMVKFIKEINLIKFNVNKIISLIKFNVPLRQSTNEKLFEFIKMRKGYEHWLKNINRL